jgi:predicted transcriptional regulator
LSKARAEQSIEPSAEARKLMEELGLSHEACSIYFSLLEKPSGETVEQILGRPSASSRDAERAVKELVDKGIVRVSSNKLEASEPRQFVARVQETRRIEMSRNLDDLNSKSSRLLSLLEPQYWELRLGIKPEDLLEPLPSLEDMEVRTVRLIADAQKLVSISAETFSWFGKVKEEIYRAIEKGVRFRLLMTARDPEARSRAREAKGLGIEVREPKEDWYPVRGTLSDDRELVFLIWATNEKDGRRPKFFRPHFTKNNGMIRVFADAFDKRWANASPI